jgi:uncharacterized protein
MGGPNDRHGGGAPAAPAAGEGAQAAPGPKGKGRRGGKRGRRRQALGLTEPHRSCLVCRRSAPPVELLRFVRAPDGGVAFDVRGALPGRGAWVCATRACLHKAADPRHGGFARSFDAACLVPTTLINDVEDTLCAAVCALLGLLRRQALLVAGREEVRRLGGAACLVGLAADLAPRSRREMEGMELPGPVVPLPPMAQLAHAVGRGRPTGVIAVGAGGGALAARLRDEAGRWAGVTAVPAAAAAAAATPAGDETGEF